MSKKTKEQLRAELDIIRELRRAPLTDKQIMEQLKLPQSTYYWYLKQIRDEDKKILEVELKENLHHEIRNLEHNLILLYQETLKILDNDKILVKDKIETIRLLKELHSDRVKLLIEGPEVLNNSTRQQANNSKSKEERTEEENTTTNK